MPPTGSANEDESWPLRMIRRVFRRYWTGVSAADLQALYRTADRDVIAARLTHEASRNAAILGLFTGLLLSADEVAAFATRGAGGLGLPLNLLIAVLVLSLEMILVFRFQVALVACLGRLYEVPFDPDDPRDLLTVLAYAAGSSAANAAGRQGMRMGGQLTARIARNVMEREAMAALTHTAERVGIRFLQMTVIKYGIPLVSMAVGLVMNYLSMRAIGRVARMHMQRRVAPGNPPAAPAS